MNLIIKDLDMDNEIVLIQLTGALVEDSNAEISEESD